MMVRLKLEDRETKNKFSANSTKITKFLVIFDDTTQIAYIRQKRKTNRGD